MRPTSSSRTGSGELLLNLVQAVFLAGWSVLWITVAVFTSIFSSEVPLALARRAWGPGLIWGARARVNVVQPPDLEPGRSYVFVMNHQSMFDVPVAFAVIPINIRFVLKRILLFVPFIGFYAWRTKMVFVDRSDPSQAYESLKRAARRIGDGISIIAFPEGTRSVGPVRRFKRGAFLLAVETGLSVVPVALHGAGDVVPRGTFRVRGGEVRVAFGDPIEPGDDPDDLRDRAQAATSQLYESLRSPSVSKRSAPDRSGSVARCARS